MSSHLIVIREPNVALVMMALGKMEALSPHTWLKFGIWELIFCIILIRNRKKKETSFLLTYIVKGDNGRIFG